MSKMSEHQHSLNGGESARLAQKHEHLYQKSLEELYDELAALNDRVADGDVDLDLIDAYLDAINTKESLPFSNLDPEESFATFSEKHALLFDENTTTAPKTPRRIHSLPRKISVAILAAAIGCSAIASASGFDIFGAVAKWSKDIFSFSVIDSTSNEPPSESSTQDHALETASIQATLDALQIEEKVVPLWIPESFKLTESRVKHMEKYTKIHSTFLSDTQEFTFTIWYYTTVEDATAATIEKAENPVESYTVKNIPHYIFTNIDVQSAVWLNNTTLCLISGDLSEEEIKAMIDSIYER